MLEPISGGGDCHLLGCKTNTHSRSTCLIWAAAQLQNSRVAAVNRAT